METKPGLRHALEKTRGAPLRFRVRDFLWELRYAWQRAWLGYDRTDVFELGYNIVNKMPILLTDFLENNIGLFYDREAGRQLDEEETNVIIKEMIFYFENCDEDHVYQRLHKKPYYEDGKYDLEKWESVRIELERCRAEALRLFSKWCFDLWY